jgi:hypothetical protein
MAPSTKKVAYPAQGAPGVARPADFASILDRSDTPALRVVPRQPTKTNVQTNTYDPDRPERHRRFYLAVVKKVEESPSLT